MVLPAFPHAGYPRNRQEQLRLFARVRPVLGDPISSRTPEPRIRRWQSRPTFYVCLDDKGKKGNPVKMLVVRYLKFVVLAVAGLLAPVSALADSACVTNGIELQNAMLQWLLMDSGTMTIKLVKGTYTLAPNSSFDAVREVNLNLLGGYRPGTNCTERDVDPTNTVLYGANSSSVQFWIYTFSDVTIEGLTFKNLRNGFSLVHHIYKDATGHTFSVRYNIFRDFQVVSKAQGTGVEGGVRIEGAPGDTGAFVSFKNNLVYNIQMDGPDPAVLLTSGHNGPLSVAYNTIAFNNEPSTIGAVQPYYEVELVNNILWNGAATALKFGLDLVGPDASYNVLGPVEGLLSGDVANIYGDPMWGANYHLAPGSPAINSGGPPDLVSGGFPSHDLDGNARVVGSAIDRGAYESPYDNSADFTVTSSLDAAHATNGSVNCNAGSSTCTLREAIVRANASAGASTIRFALACPTVVTLSSSLPDITGATTIDGYTNPGAFKNTSGTQFNATLCVFLNGNGNVAHALHTAGSGKLALSGLGFAGFSPEAAVLLDAGTGHTIGGNQFGAIAFTTGNSIGVRVTGNAGRVFIGGYDSDTVRNLISGSSYAGVEISSTNGNSVVANNYLGLQPNGSTTSPNINGIVVVNSPDNSISYNAIASSTQRGIWLYGAPTTNTIVNYNLVGYAGDGTTQRPTGGIGILVDGGASYNVIGAAANSTSGGNAVLSSGGAAIAVTNTGAVGNRILANAPLKGASDTPAIDLGQPGATANDNGDADVGANDLQNFPVVKNLFRTATAEWIEWALDSFPGDAFRLDFYRDLCCVQGPGVPPRGNVGIYLLRAGSGVTDNNGHAHGWVRLSKFSTILTWTVAATATSASGDTSELGPYAVESNDMLFRDDLELH
jgi:hypothetical protein